MMGYWMVFQVSTIRSSVMWNNKWILFVMTLSKILVIPCDMFCRIKLNSIMVIVLIGIFWGKVDGHGDVILLLK